MQETVVHNFSNQWLLLAGKSNKARSPHSSHDQLRSKTPQSYNRRISADLIDWLCGIFGLISESKKSYKARSNDVLLLEMIEKLNRYFFRKKSINSANFFFVFFFFNN